MVVVDHAGPQVVADVEEKSVALPGLGRGPLTVADEDEANAVAQDRNSLWSAHSRLHWRSTEVVGQRQGELLHAAVAILGALLQRFQTDRLQAHVEAGHTQRRRRRRMV